MADIKSQEDLEKWLEGKPVEVSRVIALRCALRVLPLVTGLNNRNKKLFLNVMLPVFRCMSSTYAISFAPPKDENFKVYASAAQASVVFASAYPAAFAALAASANSSTAFAAYALAVGSAPYFYASADIWKCVEVDCAALENGINTIELAHSPLWRSRTLKWFSKANADLKTALLPLNRDWDVWTRWFDDRVNGVKADEILEMRRVQIESADWDKGAAHVNALIRKMEEERAEELAEQNEKTIKEPSSKNYDFFISYNKKQENYAKWFDALLDNAGYKNFAQFKDIAVGNNFVVEMNKGLEGTARFIAVLSPEYKTSKHCQAEWSAAYNSDPDGSKAKLIGTLVQKHELTPLSKQLVYADFTNLALSPKDAAQKLLAAIGYKGELPSIPENWPGTLDLDASNDASGRVFVVAPGVKNLLETRPIAAQPDKDYGFGLQALLHHMHGEIESFVELTKRSSGQFQYSEGLKRAALNLHITSKIFTNDISGQDQPLTMNSRLVRCLQLLSLDTRNGNIDENDEIKFDEANLRGIYVQLGNLYPDLKIYRDSNARDKFELPTEQEAKALDETLKGLSSTELSGDVVSAELGIDLKAVGDALTETNAIETGSSKKDKADKFDAQREAHMEAAKKSIAVWTWIANARDKFKRSGKSAEEYAKTIEAYEKLYGKLSIPALEAIKYISKWFF
jgi:TIR domain